MKNNFIIIDNKYKDFLHKMMQYNHNNFNKEIQDKINLMKEKNKINFKEMREQRMINQWNLILQNLHLKLNRKIFKFRENKISKKLNFIIFRNVGELT